MFDRVLDEEEQLELGHDPNQPRLIERMKRRVTGFLQTDMIVQISGHSKMLFNCHRSVLQCYSGYFYDLGGAVTEVMLPGEQVTPEIFKSVYEWMLADDPLFPVHEYDSLVELFTAASFLRIRDLLHQCWTVFDDEDVFNEETAFCFYQKLRRTQHEDIKKILLHRISRFFLTLVASRDFVDLDCEEVMQLLQSNSIATANEVDVLFAGVRWLQFDWPAREAHMLDIVSCVRFGLMSAIQLTRFAQGFHDEHRLAPVFKHATVRQMVDDGLTFVITRDKHRHNPVSFQHFLAEFQLAEPCERQWATDPDRTPDDWMDYGQFLQYLQAVQTKPLGHWQTLVMSETNFLH
jgi:BTB And C-terminal Kelch/Domain of unknown function (DUF4734)/BTB/POZ domain